MKSKKLVESLNKIKMPEDRKDIILTKIIRAVIAVTAGIIVMAATVLVFRNINGTTYIIRQIAPAVSHHETMQQRILRQREYGMVSLSTRPGVLETIMDASALHKDEADNVALYKDENQFYLFQKDGSLAGISTAYTLEPGFIPPEDCSPEVLCKEEAIAAAEDAILKYCEYYALAEKERYRITACELPERDSTNLYPVWRLVFSEYNEAGARLGSIIAELDKWGNVSHISFGVQSMLTDEQLARCVYITADRVERQAVKALSASCPEVDPLDYRMTGSISEFGSNVIWECAFMPKSPKLGSGWVEGYIVTVNSDTGKTIVSKYKGTKPVDIG